MGLQTGWAQRQKGQNTLQEEFLSSFTEGGGLLRDRASPPNVVHEDLEAVYHILLHQYPQVRFMRSSMG